MISPRHMEVSGNIEKVNSGDSMLSPVVVRISGDEQLPR